MRCAHPRPGRSRAWGTGGAGQEELGLQPGEHAAPDGWRGCSLEVPGLSLQSPRGPGGWRRQAEGCAVEAARNRSRVVSLVPRPLTERKELGECWRRGGVCFISPTSTAAMGPAVGWPILNLLLIVFILVLFAHVRISSYRSLSRLKTPIVSSEAGTELCSDRGAQAPSAPTHSWNALTDNEGKIPGCQPHSTISSGPFCR